jgi:hypothetical protein
MSYLGLLGFLQMVNFGAVPEMVGSVVLDALQNELVIENTMGLWQLQYPI